jgi:hypothetical protein
MTRFRLRFPGTRIQRWASRFSDPGDDAQELAIGLRAKERGHLTKEDFVHLCRWKTPRSRRLVEKNPDEFVGAVTGTALSTPNERLRIEVLTLLDGVDWPTASVILHFAHRDPYPILDFRALWSLGIEKPPKDDFPFWQAYTQTCRGLAEKHSCTMRTLDRALWQYSKEHQRG